MTAPTLPLDTSPHREAETARAASDGGAARALRIIGLDLSLTATGVAGLGWTETLRPPAKLRGHERLSWIRNAAASFTRDADVVCVEGPSYGNANRGQRGHHERAGLWWLVTHSLWRAHAPTVVVTPAQIKKYATGAGNADKQTVLLAVVKRWPMFDAKNDNESDAAVMVAMGLDYYGAPLAPMPAKHRDALGLIEWPPADLLERTG